MPEVKHWVRNLSRHSNSSLWFPTSTDLFYPDFVAELADGRILVVEYKGEPYTETKDTLEKRNIGELWEEKSGGRGLFLMAVKRDERGRDVRIQLTEKIKGKPLNTLQ
jgi:type III restriction enzyme